MTSPRLGSPINLVPLLVALLVQIGFGQNFNIKRNGRIEPAATDSPDAIEDVEYWYCRGTEDPGSGAYASAETFERLVAQMEKWKRWLEGPYSRFSGVQYTVTWGTPVAVLKKNPNERPDPEEPQLAKEVAGSLAVSLSRARMLLDASRGEKNPYGGVGSQTMEYIELLGDSVGLAKKLSAEVGTKLSDTIENLSTALSHLTEEAQSESISTASGNWIFADSDRRYITAKQLQNLSPDELWRARNEIYARRGYIFRTAKGRALADSLGSSYRPTTSDQNSLDLVLNDFEKANVLAIKSFEAPNRPRSAVPSSPVGSYDRLAQTEAGTTEFAAVQSSPVETEAIGMATAAPTTHSTGRREFRSLRFDQGECIYVLENGTLSIDMLGSDMSGRVSAQIPIADIKGPLLMEGSSDEPAVQTALGGWNFMMWLQMNPDKAAPNFPGYGKAGLGGNFSIGFDNESDLKEFLAALGAGTDFKAPEYMRPIIVSGPVPPTPTPEPSQPSDPSRTTPPRGAHSAR